MNSVSNVCLQKVNLGIPFSVLLFWIGTVPIGMLLSGKVHMHVIFVVPGCYSGDRTHKKVGYTAKVECSGKLVMFAIFIQTHHGRTTWPGLTETTQQRLKTSLSVYFSCPFVPLRLWVRIW